MQHILLGLRTLHAAGVVHSAIKPENIFVSDSSLLRGRVLVGEWNLTLDGYGRSAMLIDEGKSDTRLSVFVSPAVLGLCSR